ncbi:hypothetical protein BKA93DRAFT_61205 [Sparassis latifolia]
MLMIMPSFSFHRVQALASATAPFQLHVCFPPRRWLCLGRFCEALLNLLRTSTLNTHALTCPFPGKWSPVNTTDRQLRYLPASWSPTCDVRVHLHVHQSSTAGSDSDPPKPKHATHERSALPDTLLLQCGVSRSPVLRVKLPACLPIVQIRPKPSVQYSISRDRSAGADIGFARALPASALLFVLAREYRLCLCEP